MHGPHGPVEDIPEVVTVAIYAADHGYYLLRYDASNQIVADTWHVSLGEAQSQAAHEYLIGPNDWREERIALETIDTENEDTDRL